MASSYPRGTIRIEALPVYFRVDCSRCKDWFVGESKREKIEALLWRQGWRKLRELWVCPLCHKQPNVDLRHVGVHSSMRRLLELWLQEGTWNKQKFLKELGVSKQALYKTRERLVQRGFATPEYRSRLTVKKRVKDEPTGATAFERLFQLQALEQRESSELSPADESGRMHGADIPACGEH